MLIKLGYETVKAIDDGGLKLSFLGSPPNIFIPPILSLEVLPAPTLSPNCFRQNAKNTKRETTSILISAMPPKYFVKC